MSERENQSGSSENPVVDSALAEYMLAQDTGKPIDVGAWLDRYPEYRAELLQFLADQARLAKVLGGTSTPKPVASLDETTVYQAPKASPKSTRDVSLGKFGKYELTRMLGAGGMGQVFEAVDESGKHVALKVLASDLMHAKESLERFKQEGALASTINHPRCVFVESADEHEGRPYIVMELMTGKTLKDLVVSRGPIPYKEAITLILDVIDGLIEAHDTGTIHRDVKPANCYLEENGRVKIGDFGLSRSMTEGSDLTQTGSFIGTPLYASPEQIRGGQLDQRTDIYSVCATLFNLVTGHAPFESANPALVIARIASEDAPLASSFNAKIPKVLDEILVKGLKRSREKRYQSLQSLREELATLLDERGSIATLGVRFAAYGIDSLLLSAVGTLAATLLQNGSSTKLQVPPFSFYIAIMSAIWLYYFGCEFFKGATVGKFLLRLRVVDSNSNLKASVLRVFLRSILYILISGTITDTILYMILKPDDLNQWAIWQWLGYLLSIVVAFCTFWRNGEYRLSYEWLSGTRVINLGFEQDQLRFERRIPNWEMHSSEVTHTDKLPAEFTNFAFIGKAAGGEVYRARDPRLGRSVWVCISPSEEAVSAARQKIARHNRVRWLQSGKIGNSYWNSFVAPTGVPLLVWVAKGKSLKWNLIKRILYQLADELRHATDDNTLPAKLTLNQIMVDAKGRVLILDEPIQWTGVQQGDKNEPLRPLAFLQKSAELMLYGDVKPERIVTEIPVAIHAQDTLKVLFQAKDEKQLGEIVNSIGVTLSKSSEVSLRSRIVQTAVFCLCVSAFFGLALVLLRFINHIQTAEIGRQLGAASLIANSKWDGKSLPQEVLKTVPELESLTQTEFGEKVEARREQLEAEYSIRYDNAGSFNARILDQMGFSPRSIEHFRESKIPLPKEPWRVLVFRPDSESPQLELEVREGDYLKFLRSLVEISPPRLTPKVQLILLFWLPPYAMLVLWSLVFRSGVSYKLAGLQLVDRRGRLAHRLRVMVRSMITLSPFFFLQMAIGWIDLYYPNLGWMAYFLSGLFLAMPLLIVAHVLYSPRRSLSDYLAGTYVVAR